MFLDEFATYGGGGEPKRSLPPIKSSKGYPEKRDPAAENPRGVLKNDLDEASLRRLRQHYGPALKS